MVTFEPVLSRLKRRGGHLIFDSRRIPGEVVDVLVVRDAVFPEYRATIRRLLRRWFAALDYLHAQPVDAAERMRGRLRLTVEEILKQYQGLRLPNAEENRRFLSGHEALLARTARMLAEVMLTAGLLRKPVSLDGLLDPSCLPGGGR